MSIDPRFIIIWFLFFITIAIVFSAPHPALSQECITFKQDSDDALIIPGSVVLELDEGNAKMFAIRTGGEDKEYFNDITGILVIKNLHIFNRNLLIVYVNDCRFGSLIVDNQVIFDGVGMERGGN